MYFHLVKINYNFHVLIITKAFGSWRRGCSHSPRSPRLSWSSQTPCTAPQGQNEIDQGSNRKSAFPGSAPLLGSQSSDKLKIIGGCSLAKLNEFIATRNWIVPRSNSGVPMRSRWPTPPCVASPKSPGENTTCVGRRDTPRNGNARNITAYHCHENRWVW